MAARIVVAALLICAAAVAVTAQEDRNEDCLLCHGKQDAVVEFADGEMSAFVDSERYRRSSHRRLACIECHTRVGEEADDHPDRDLPDRREYTLELNRSCERCHGPDAKHGAKPITQVVHPAGSGKAPVCTDCHRAHAMGTTDRRAVTISHACQSCHQDVYAAFTKSAHGDAVRSDNPDLPTCTSCHAGHEDGGKSPAARRVRLGRPCIGCHADKRLMDKYDLSTGVVTSYLEDFHGVSVKFYQQEQQHDIRRYPLVCADCHGVHDVAAAREVDPAVMKARVADACAKCHEDAAASFPDAWLSHYEPSLSKNALVFLVKVFYWGLIPFVILGLLIHISFHLVVLPIRRRRQRARGVDLPDHGPPKLPTRIPRLLPRFTVRQRLEHLIVMVTFVVLIVTGLPQKFHDAAWATTLVGWMGGIDLVRLLHRIAGWVFAAAAVIHFFTVGGAILLGKMKMTMVPKAKDFRDAISTLRYYLGTARSMPRADRFDYRQKFEYWGMVLGGVIMALTGVMLIYPMIFSKYLPGQFIPAAKTMHSYEAVMALLTIIIWHMYGARFDRSIFTGKIEAKKLAHHHPLEYERIVRTLDRDDRGDPDREHRAPHAPSPERAPEPIAVTAGSEE